MWISESALIHMCAIIPNWRTHYWDAQSEIERLNSWYVWHDEDSFICVTRFRRETLLREKWKRDTFWDTSRFSSVSKCVSLSHIHMCDPIQRRDTSETRSCLKMLCVNFRAGPLRCLVLWHDSFICVCVTWLMSVWHDWFDVYVTHSCVYVRQDAFKTAEMSCMCDMTHSYVYVWHDSFICVCATGYIQDRWDVVDGVATISRLLKIIGLFCKRAL